MSHDMDEVDTSETGDRTVETEANPAAVRHDWRQSDDPSVALVEAVAAETDRTATDLPPLQHTIDPDALDALLTGNRSSAVSISFRYADAVVSIHRNGSIEVKVDGSLAQEGGD